MATPSLPDGRLSFPSAPSFHDAVVESLGRLSSHSLKVVIALLETRGAVGRPDAFAQSLGFRNRHQLRRSLAASGLPCLEDLAGWIRILIWVEETTSSGRALSRRALEDGKDPSPWFRQVRRLTGKTWREVLFLGRGWVLGCLANMIVASTCEEPQALRRRPAWALRRPAWAGGSVMTDPSA